MAESEESFFYSKRKLSSQQPTRSAGEGQRLDGLQRSGVRTIARTHGTDMKANLFGATGMVGHGVLRECLRDDGVEGMLA